MKGVKNYGCQWIGSVRKTDGEWTLVLGIATPVRGELSGVGTQVAGKL